MTLIDKIFAAGLVGCGGAGFPTHVKFNTKVDYLIINAAECEPLLRTDRYIMKHYASKLISAIEDVGKFVGASQCIIALKGGYIKEIASLETAILALASKVRIHKMDSFYPAGDEQIIVNEVTGKIVPPAGIPLDVGCLVSNVATMLCVSDALVDKPFTHKFLTVTGEVQEPCVLYVPIGTSFKECIELAGGALLQNYAVISGGPMMGKPILKEDLAHQYVSKTTSGILILDDSLKIINANVSSLKNMLNRAKSACIQCRLCTDMCPRNMLGHPIEPHKVMRTIAMANSFEETLEHESIKNAMYCCECGVCEVIACPMQLQPRRVNAVIKQLFAKNGVRAQKGTSDYVVNDQREYRKIPTKRAASRAGVLKYNSYAIDTLKTYEPAYVKIALRQSIGSPSEPMVQINEKVKCGQLIAKCPDGKLGTNLHASIDGVIKGIDDHIVIEREE